MAGTIENDPEFGTDRLASAVMEFSKGQAVFSVGTQTNYFQHMTLLGTTGRIDVEIPFNAPTNKPLPLTISNGMEFIGGTSVVEMIPAADQYTIQGDAFSKAIRDNAEVPVPLEDAIANMKVIDAIFRSAKSGKWEKP